MILRMLSLPSRLCNNVVFMKRLMSRLAGDSIIQDKHGRLGGIYAQS